MPNTHVRIGNGPHQVIGLHGWFGCAQGWGPFPAALDGKRYSYAFMDARGYGGMRDASGPWTMEQVAQDALALADALGWQRFSLIGHSMAGVAIQLAWLQAPERVRSLVAITPVPASGVTLDDDGQQLFGAAAGDPAARRTIIDFTTGNRLTGTWLDAATARSVEQSSPQAVAGYLASWTGARLVERVSSREQPPVLVLPGEHDPALGEAVCRATWMQHYPGAQLEVLRNAGHYPMDEIPIFLATTIERFLAQVAS